MMQFHSLWAFLLLAILTATAAFHFWRRNRRTPAFLFSSVLSLKTLRKTWRVHASRGPFLLRLAAIALMIVALARPQSAETRIRRDVEGIDIVLLVDLSLTMMIEDMGGKSRLEAAKAAQIQFVRNRPTDRVGIVAFAGEAFTAVPLTLDHAVVEQTLLRLDNTERLRDGTAQGVAIATGVARLKDSAAKSRIMVFVTDGENNTGSIDPGTALEIARGYGIKIYVVGIGSDGRKKLPIKRKDVFGHWIKTYQDMDSTFYESQMMEIAEKTGGRYWRSRDLEELREVYTAIDRLEKTKIESAGETLYNELFAPLAAAALALYFLSWLLPLTFLQKGPVA